jgi:hypothetical protein
VTYVVDYQIGSSYSGTIEVVADDGAETDHIIAIAKRQLFRRSGGHPPPHYVQIFKVRP